MLSNKEVSGLFKTLGALMELHGENDFKTKSYTNAAFQLGRVTGSVMEMPEAELDNIQGVGKSIIGKIKELRNSGTIAALEEYMQKTPPGLVEILQIKGLGGKKVGMIWRDLGIESVGELLYACNENRLASLKGFGEKTQESVIKSIEYFQSNIGKFHYARIAAAVDEIIGLLKERITSDKISLCGDIRRKCNVIEKLEIICAESCNIANNLYAFPFLLRDNNAENLISGKTTNDIHFEISIVPDQDYYFELFKKTGSEKHVDIIVQKLNNKTQFDSEEAIYQAAGYSYISPEFREEHIDLDSLEEASIITLQDIRGVVHNHSTWSDGKNTVEEKALACKKGGYEYFVISDHSKTAFYAGGLTETQIVEQQKEIETLNIKYPDFKIFKSIECDILTEGKMDYANEILSSFDLVIASIHQNLKMDEQKATARLLGAIENPYTTILGHMTGRLLLSRPGYPVDHKKIIEACAANDVVIEINANPYRLDIDNSWIPYALKNNVMISINPDAHSLEGIKDINWGVISARKGGLTKSMTWNGMNRAEIESWLMNRKKKKGIS